MRKWILLFILAFEVFGAMALHADVSTTATMWISSFTQTADTTKKIPCNTIEPKAGCRFHGVIVSSGGINSSVTIYNSSASANNIVAILNTDVATMKDQNYFYDVYLSSGLTYTTVGTANITILYAKPTIR